jgi:hypothetical protein
MNFTGDPTWILLPALVPSIYFILQYQSIFAQRGNRKYNINVMRYQNRHGYFVCRGSNWSIHTTQTVDANLWYYSKTEVQPKYYRKMREWRRGKNKKLSLEEQKVIETGVGTVQLGHVTKDQALDILTTIVRNELEFDRRRR